jgi:hypothetical protein
LEPFGFQLYLHLLFNIWVILLHGSLEVSSVFYLYYRHLELQHIRSKVVIEASCVKIIIMNEHL